MSSTLELQMAQWFLLFLVKKEMCPNMPEIVATLMVFRYILSRTSSVRLSKALILRLSSTILPWPRVMARSP